MTVLSAVEVLVVPGASTMRKGPSTRLELGVRWGPKVQNSGVCGPRPAWGHRCSHPLVSWHFGPSRADHVFRYSCWCVRTWVCVFLRPHGSFHPWKQRLKLLVLPNSKWDRPSLVGRCQVDFLVWKGRKLVFALRPSAELLKPREFPESSEWQELPVFP